MSKRSRVRWFGAAGLVVGAGAGCAALVSGTAGQLAAFVLIGLGLVWATSLLFLEVGLGEDRQLELERRERERRTAASERWLRRHLPRMRGQRRRLG
jgi:hypothetical protein